MSSQKLSNIPNVFDTASGAKGKGAEEPGTVITGSKDAMNPETARVADHNKWKADDPLARVWAIGMMKRADWSAVKYTKALENHRKTEAWYWNEEKKMLDAEAAKNPNAAWAKEWEADKRKAT